MVPAVAEEQAGLVLSDADFVDFTTLAQWKWAETYVQKVMKDATIVFVGTSMSDPNLLRWLSAPLSRYVGQRSPNLARRVWVVARNGFPVNKNEWDCYEAMLKVRWWRHDVAVHAVDRFSDVDAFLRTL